MQKVNSLLERPLTKRATKLTIRATRTKLTLWCLMDYYLRPTNFIAIQKLVAELGGDPNHALQMVDIEPDEIGKPEAMFPAFKLFDLLESAARITGRKDFGLLWGSMNDFNRMGPLAAYLKNCPSIGKAIGDSSKFATSLNWGVKSAIKQLGNSSRLELEILPSGKFPQHQYVESLMIALVPLWNELLGEEWRPTEVWFLHQPIADQETYEWAFRCPVKFGQRANAIVAPTSDFHTRRSPLDVHSQTQVQSLLEAEVINDQQRFVRLVTGVIKRTLPQYDVTMVRVARELSMSTAVFQRKLEECGRTLKSLLTEVRINTFLEFKATVGSSNTLLMKAIGIRDHSTFAKFARQHAGKLGLSETEPKKISITD